MLKKQNEKNFILCYVPPIRKLKKKLFSFTKVRNNKSSLFYFKMNEKERKELYVIRKASFKHFYDL